MTRDMKRSTPKRQLHLIAIGLVLLTSAVYWRVLGFEFINFDDPLYILRNSHVRDGLSLANLVWAFNAGYASNWHPLTWISHMMDCTLFGVNPMGHHAVSLLLHLASTVLLFLVLNRLTKSQWKSAFVAALFAVHPIHVESVAWVAERKDVLSALFWMLTMWAYLRYTERPGIRRYSLVALTLALGLMAKPMLVTLPLVLLLLDYWPLGRFARESSKSKQAQPWPGWYLVREKLPLLGLAAISSVLTFIAQRRGESLLSMSAIPPALRIENAFVSCATYLLKMVWPSKLAPFYPFQSQGLPAWEIAVSALVVVGISVLVYSKRKSAPYLTFGWAWYLLTLLPVIGLVQVGSQAMADRYTYIPLIGVFVAIAWEVSGSVGVRECGSKGVREKGSKGEGKAPIHPFTHSPILPIVSGAIIAALMVCTWIQLGYWKNSLVLFTHTMNVTENNYTAYASLASAYAEKKDYAEAEGYYAQALQYRSEIPTLHFDYANTLYALGKVDEAIAEYEEALKLDPDYEDARNNLDAVIHKRQYAAQANAILQKSGSNPGDAATHMNKAVALDAEGRSDEALREYKEALRINPGFAEAHSNLGVLYRNRGDLDAAIGEYKEAIRIKPKFGQAHVNLAIAYFLKGDYAGSWREVHVCEGYGMSVGLELLQALSEKMPDPGN